MEITSITPTGFKVLEALNTYRFLTIPQMLRLGIAKDRGNLSKVLSSMISAKRDDSGIPRPKEIGVLDFGSIAGIGRLARCSLINSAMKLTWSGNISRGFPKTARPLPDQVPVSIYAQATSIPTAYIKSLTKISDRGCCW